ncbi:MAG: DUF1801 domain-containing protein [Actinomycetota bacterium]|nr:DUF1801 domain-containing protein [Actinomycetota bacterium]
MTPTTEVDDYLAAAPSDRQPAMEALREACLQLLPGFSESFRYGLPSYGRDDDVEIAFANHEEYISFYVSHADIINAHQARLGGLSVDKDCIRYRHPDQIDMDVVRSILMMNALTSA